MDLSESSPEATLRTAPSSQARLCAHHCARTWRWPAQEAWAAVTTVDPTSPDAAAAAQAKRQELGGAFIALMFTDHPHLMQLFTFARGARAGEVDPVRMKVHGSKTIGAVDAIVGHVARGDDAELIR